MTFIRGTGILQKWTEEIENYMSGLGDIVFAEKTDRQMTGNISRMILDMSCQWNFAWNDNETIQAYEAWEQNRRLRKIETVVLLSQQKADDYIEVE